MKFKFLQAVVVGLMLSVCSIVNVANAGLITESWEAEVESTESSSFFVGQILNWTVEYDTDSLISHTYFPGTEIIMETYDGSCLGRGLCVYADLNADANFGLSSIYDALVAGLQIGETLYSVNPFDYRTVTRSTGSANTYYNEDKDGFYATYNLNNQGFQGFGLGFYSNINSGDSYNVSIKNARITSVDTGPTPVPEPSTLAIFALGIMGLASRRFKKQ